LRRPMTRLAARQHEHHDFVCQDTPRESTVECAWCEATEPKRIVWSSFHNESCMQHPEWLGPTRCERWPLPHNFDWNTARSQSLTAHRAHRLHQKSVCWRRRRLKWSLRLGLAGQFSSLTRLSSWCSNYWSKTEGGRNGGTDRKYFSLGIS